MKTEDTAAYAAALLLHPACRKGYILKNWRKSWHKKAFDSVKALWDTIYKDRPITLLNSNTQPSTHTNLTEEPDEYDLMARELDITTINPTKDEYESFVNADPIAIDGTALAWWCQEAQRLAYPRLSQMAIDILSIAAMSAEPERVFSGARRTISWDRARLGGNQIMKLECLKAG